MTGTLTEIWRHPIKSIGRESLASVALKPGQTLPYDRAWAVTHAGARLEGEGWAHKRNFLRGVTDPNLMAVTCEMDGGLIHLHHPQRPDLTFDPTGAADPLLEWLAPIWSDDQPAPNGLRHLASGFTDVPDPWVAINNHASHRAVEQRVGRNLSIHRWRGNLWVEGFALWEEFDWVGKTLQIGAATVKIHCPITRCKATMANPETGKRDADTLAALRSWDHQDFGVYAEVIEGGTIEPGAEVKVL